MLKGRIAWEVPLTDFKEILWLRLIPDSYTPNSVTRSSFTETDSKLLRIINPLLSLVTILHIYNQCIFDSYQSFYEK